MLNVLFVCSENSCRSIMAEAMLTKLGHGRFRAYSGAARASGEVNRRGLAQLRSRGYPVAGLSSKSWHTFCDEGAPVLDFVIVVCDLAALQTQPHWPGSPVKLWWNFEPPGAARGSEAEIGAVFDKVARELEAALSKFVLLPFEQINRDEWSSLAHCVPVKV